MHKYLSKLVFYFFVFLKYSFCLPDSLNTVTLHTYLQEKKDIAISQFSKKIEIKNKIKRVVIFCPAYLITGGVENLCQIYAALKNHGYEVYMIWTTSDFPQIMKKYENEKSFLCKIDSRFLNHAYIENYQVNYLDKDLILDEETLVIVPEIWIDIIYFFENAKKVIAWLSINNLNGCNSSEICKSLIHNQQLSYLDCIHISQAPWIVKTLKSWGASSFLLGDYISKEYLEITNVDKVENLIAFFPRKGGKLALSFMDKYSDLNYLRLENFTKKEMIFALDVSKIYIDFGTFPGKDRIPREALLRGCVIFIHNQGCATDYESFPVDDYFRFSTEDVSNGVLYEKIKETLANYTVMQEKQNYMREQVFQEYNLFEKKVKDIFGIPLV